MELILSQLESERTRLKRELLEAQRESSDKDAICSSLESRLKQRDNQLTELQSELSLKTASYNNLEREVRWDQSTFRYACTPNKIVMIILRIYDGCYTPYSSIFCLYYTDQHYVGKNCGELLT